VRNIPVIKYGNDGLPLHHASDFHNYGINVSGFQITDWDFEQKTLDQISRKWEATMGIITAKADAERARQEALTAEVAYKQEQIFRGEGDGEYKRLVMSADGALTAKLNAWQTVRMRYAEAIEKQKWMPDQMGGNQNGAGSAAMI
jgi:regulator of protease activity HflC (stomatin/prohibitin superfamily)